MTGQELYEILIESHASAGSPNLSPPFEELPQVFKDGWNLGAVGVTNRLRMEQRPNDGIDWRKFN